MEAEQVPCPSGKKKGTQKKGAARGRYYHGRKEAYLLGDKPGEKLLKKRKKNSAGGPTIQRKKTMRVPSVGVGSE